MTYKTGISKHDVTMLEITKPERRENEVGTPYYVVDIAIEQGDHREVITLFSYDITAFDNI